MKNTTCVQNCLIKGTKFCNLQYVSSKSKKKNGMAGSVGGQDETNPKLPLATLGTKFCNLRYVSSKSKKKLYG